MEDSMRMAISGAVGMLYRGYVRTREEQFAMVDSITAEQVQEAARRYLNRTELRLAAVGPDTMTIPARSALM
jgi:predicted Zn-dependent peptidase